MGLNKITPINIIRRLFVYLSEKYCPFDMRTFQILMGAGTAVLLGIVLMLGWTSSKKVKEVVTNDFNQQQLVLARHAAGQIENDLDVLKKELSLLSFSPSVQYAEKVSIANRTGITFSSIKEKGAIEIRYMESGGRRTHLVDDGGFRTVPSLPENVRYLEWSRKEENKGRIMISEILADSRPVTNGSSMENALILKIATPVWQVSVDETHPVASNRFSGVLIFVIDATAFIEKVTKGIKSGKTGYAWVMDNKGTFLYHPEREFMGKNAFEARKEKKPTISFARINEIQKEMMLAGREGTSWYVSGWHRGSEGEMRKLIAYSPIHLAPGGGTLWSVAVVAPISEVEDAIHSIQLRQFMLQAIIVVIILFGGLTVVSLVINWSHMMEQEVERKTIEFKKSEQRYKSLVEHAEDIIFTVDNKGNILSMNRFGYILLKKEPEDVIGSNIAALCSDESALAQLQGLQEVFRSNTTRQVVCSLTIDGRQHWLSTNFSGLHDEKGEVFAVLGIARDITRRRKMEEQMFYTEKLASIGTLAAGVAHEINNPLAIILGFTDLLLEKTPPGSESHDILKTIEKQGLNAKRVVENLLSFTRLGENREEMIDVNRNIEAVLSVISNTLLLNKISVDLELGESLPAVRGDSGELQQVFFNLINNAVSEMKGGGFLTLETRTADDGQKVEIRVTDTGCGIRKEHRARIFDPLFTTKKVGEGTGLGLFVSYGIITKHGGTMTFETKTNEECSESGTTFIITLPTGDTANQRESL